MQLQPSMDEGLRRKWKAGGGGYTDSMLRRWLLVLLMSVLPLQSSWAAIGTCICLDEAADTVELLHDVAQASGMPAPVPDPGDEGCDPMCSTCHFGSAHMPASPPAQAVAATPGQFKAAAPPLPTKTHIPSGLDRPDWPAA